MKKNKTIFKKGDTIHWNDPDHGISSGKYKIADIYCENENEINEDTIFLIKGIGKNIGEAEVVQSEIKKIK
jgi:hypothetical protein